MKRKYYLRGVGAGILFATIVLVTAYSISNGGRMTDQEVMKRAEELGMVKAESVLDNLDKPASRTGTEENTSTEEPSTNPPSTKDGSTEKASTEEPSTEEPSTNRTNSEENTEDTEEPSTADSSSSGRTVTFTVVSGMSSWNVATILQDQGVIADASDFDNYLETNGYSSRIATGEYSVTVGMDYESIAKLITGR